ncbi:MAG: circadian clock KaiB family protein [Gammaproteobacteria bacterium]
MTIKKAPTLKTKLAQPIAPDGARVSLRLYIAGNAPNSRLAIGNLTAICAERLAGRYELDIIDVLIAPQRALADGILVTPSLAVLGPGPAVRIVGNLNDRAGVLHALGIE